MSRDHETIVSDLFHLTDGLLALELRLWQASGQYPKPHKPKRPGNTKAAVAASARNRKVLRQMTGIDFLVRAQATSRLDKARLAKALASFTGDQYPAVLVKLVESYRREAVAPEGADALSFLIATFTYQVLRSHLAQQGEAGLQRVIDAVQRFKSTATVRTVERALSFGRGNSKELLLAGRVYTALAAGTKAAVQGDLFVDEPAGSTRLRMNARKANWKPRTDVREPLKSLLVSARPPDEDTIATKPRGVLRSVVDRPTWSKPNINQRRASTRPKGSGSESTPSSIR